MKKLFILTSALIAIGAAPALAADLAARPYTKAPPLPAPVMTWTGFYLGVQGGGGWGRSNETFFGAPNTAAFIGTQNYDITGGFVGGVAGYNWQIGQAVIGVEGDYHWADINGRSGVINVGPPSLGDTYFTKIRGFGDIKGRLGYAAGSALFFVSGGAAVGDLRHTYDAGGAAQNNTRWGWTLGVGGEYMFAPNWSAKLEYNYVDFGKSTIQYTAVPIDRSEWKDTVHTLKAGVMYHFGGPVVARY